VYDLNTSESQPERRPAHRPASLPSDHGEPVLASVDLRQIYGMARRQLWLLVGGLLVGAGLAVYRVSPETTSYTARSSVTVVNERRSCTRGLAGPPALDPMLGASDPIQSQIQILQSETVLRAVVEEHGLRFHVLAQADDLPRSAFEGVRIDPEASTDTFRLVFNPNGYSIRVGNTEAAAAYGQPAEISGARFTLSSPPQIGTATAVIRSTQAAVNDLRGGLAVRQRDRTNVIEVLFTAPDPVIARQVANAVSETAQALSGRFAQQQSQRRRLFLEQQLQQTDSALRAAQGALSSFRSDLEFYSSRDQIGIQQSQLLDQRRRQEEIRTERRNLSSFLASLEPAGADGTLSRLRDLPSTPGLSSNRIVGHLYAQLAQYDTERSSLTTGPWARSSTDPEVQRLDALIRDTEGNLLRAVRGHLATLEDQLATLEDVTIQSGSALRSLPHREAEELRLIQEAESLRQLSNQIRSEHQRARIAEMVEAGQLEVLDLAGSASANTGRRTTAILLWMVFGLMLGGAAAALRENFDRSVHGPEQMETLLQIPELGIIPPISGPYASLRTRNGLSKRPWPRLNAGPAGNGSEGHPDILELHGSEAFRLLRTNLSFSQPGRSLRTVVVTSTDPGEGKTTTAANLAVVSAQQGKRVLLIDADLHRPKLHRVFRIPRAPGLAQYLSDVDSLIADSIHETSVPNLFLLPSGVRDAEVPFPGIERITSLFDRIRTDFDLIIIDTPPLRATADASLLGALADGVLLVVRAGKTDRDSLQRAMQGLLKVGANVIGAVLNDPDAKVPRYAGSYHYPHAYYATAHQG
jgi:polysaccharide biosynthesis transport protein